MKTNETFGVTSRSEACQLSCTAIGELYRGEPEQGCHFGEQVWEGYATADRITGDGRYGYGWARAERPDWFDLADRIADAALARETK